MILILRYTLLAAVLAITGVSPAESQSAMPSWQRVELASPDGTFPFAIYSNRPWRGDMKSVKAAVLVFHGVSRRGNNYYVTAEKLLAESGSNVGETLLLAPNFFAPADAARHRIDGMPLWDPRRSWSAGSDATNWPHPLSAFEVIDALLLTLADRTRFPHLARITLAGHSAGGQLVHRYAVLNALDEKLGAAGLAVRYVVANPSSYLYFTDERPLASGFIAYNRNTCARFNTYRYGLEGLPRYAEETNGADLFKRYAARDVTYLLGTDDNDPEHRDLDKSCGAKAAGAHRLERGRNYIRYERHLAGTATRLKRLAYEVEGVGHQQSRMFGSKCAAHLLFGTPQEQNGSGARCRETDP
jgi:hypothetical protein